MSSKKILYPSTPETTDQFFCELNANNSKKKKRIPDADLTRAEMGNFLKKKINKIYKLSHENQSVMIHGLCFEVN